MFLDKHLEQQFQESYLSRSENHLRKTALVVGTLFFLFLIYDFSSYRILSSLAVIVLCRLSFLLLSILFYFKPDYFLKSSAFLKITIYELILVILYFVIMFNYESTHFLIRAFGLNVIILGIFILIPNLLYYKLFLSFLTWTIFLFITITLYHPPFNEMISVFFYLLLTIFFCSTSTYSLNKYKRLDFLNKLYFMELSTKDPLTDAYNRLKFNEALSSELEVAKRYGNTFSLIMFDIDHFKQFNDQNGHSFGDKVLKAIANLVQESVREVDVFARWGGEEFVILLPQTHCQEASALAERLRTLIYKESLKKEMDLTCSFGVTSFLSQDDQELIMERVDRALYKAKEGGRNIVVTEYNLQVVSA